MVTQMNRDWALVDGDDILYGPVKTKQEVLQYAWDERLTMEDADIVALPQSIDRQGVIDG